MFVFFSLLAASVDGFVRGFIIGAMGVKILFGDLCTIFGVIYLFCCATSLTGSLLAHTMLNNYLNLLGVAVLAGLAWSSFRSDTNIVQPHRNLATVSLSVAVDAGAACLYLSVCGYNPLYVSLVSAVLHTVLMYIAATISNRIIKEKWIKYTRYMAGTYFLTMAAYKLIVP